jgi:hypothetical protein
MEADQTDSSGDSNPPIERSIGLSRFIEYLGSQNGSYLQLPSSRSMHPGSSSDGSEAANDRGDLAVGLQAAPPT